MKLFVSAFFHLRLVVVGQSCVRVSSKIHNQRTWDRSLRNSISCGEQSDKFRFWMLAEDLDLGIGHHGSLVQAGVAESRLQKKAERGRL